MDDLARRQGGVFPAHCHDHGALGVGGHVRIPWGVAFVRDRHTKLMAMASTLAGFTELLASISPTPT